MPLPIVVAAVSRKRVVTRAKKLLADHAITRGRDESERISHVQSFTGQSLKGPPGSAPTMKLADSAA